MLALSIPYATAGAYVHFTGAIGVPAAGLCTVELILILRSVKVQLR
jgi:hypothetical protein